MKAIPHHGRISGMRIGVVSDTHMFGSRHLPLALEKGLQNTDLILHAGDWISLDTVSLFRQIAPVEGVAGNNDWMDILKLFGRKKLLNLSGYKVGLIHGDGFRKTTEVRLMKHFSPKHRQLLSLVIPINLFLNINRGFCCSIPALQPIKEYNRSIRTVFLNWRNLYLRSIFIITTRDNHYFTKQRRSS